MKDFLFDDFDEVSAKEWKQRIQYDLKGADYNETVVWKSPEGIHVKPFYHQDDFTEKPDAIPGHPSHWLIAQTIFVDDEKIANKLAIDALNRGAESIIFKAEKTFDINLLHHNIPFEEGKLIFNLNFSDEDFFDELIAFLKNNNVNYLIQFDPIGQLVQSGNWFKNQKTDFGLVEKFLVKDSDVIGVNLETIQNSGATIVQQLAYGLAHANEYLNRFAGEFPKLKMSFRFAMGSNYFFEISKLRAFRKLYAILAREYGISSTCTILAGPSKRNKTIYDYNVNMLRTTTECMSAVLGGADVVSNLAYDAIFHKSNEFGERISRNQLLILKEESYFDVVSNPADGAYYIEKITDELAEKALVIFKEIEKSGGYLKQLGEGVIQKKIKESAEKEQELFNAGALKLLGTNFHENPMDRMKNNLELFPFLKQNPVKTLIEPIIPRRLAEGQEQERLNKEE